MSAFLDLPFDIIVALIRAVSQDFPERYGQFELLRAIGTGGMAEVFLAEAVEGPLRGQRLALKRMLSRVAVVPEYVDLFLGEADVMRRLDHPNIIKVLEAGELDGSYYMALEYIDGKDLGHIIDACIARDILLPVDFVCFVVDTVLQALDYAHHLTNTNGEYMGLVHCDVSPSNIFVSDLGEIYLGDFGVATMAHQHPAETIGVVGKLAYMAPEQVRRDKLTAATDIFALGAVFYELLTNTQAFSGQNTDLIFQNISRGRFPKPRDIRPELSEAVESVCMRMLSPRLDRRGLAPWRVGLRNFFTRKPPRYRGAQVVCTELQEHYDAYIGTPLAIASVVRGLFKRHGSAA